MAVMHSRGEMQVGDHFTATSIIDSRFDCTIRESTSIGETKAIIPTIRGRGWITGTHQLMCDPEDPWPSGYRLTDTWPKQKINK
jgi:proline racemase